MGLAGEAWRAARANGEPVKAGQRSPPEEARMGASDGARLLLVEADRRLRTHLRAALEGEGFAVRTVASETRALVELHSSAFPLVVLVDARHLRLLTVVLPDRRMAYHHTFILLGAAPICEDAVQNCSRTL